MKLQIRSFVLGVMVAGIPAVAVFLSHSGPEPAQPSPANDAPVEPGRPAATAPREAERPLPAAEPPAREELGLERSTPGALRQLLSAASTRREQIDAITALLENGSPEAMQVLLDMFLATDDKVLLALLEEALLRSPHVVTPNLMAKFSATSDPNKLDTLAKMLLQAAANRPELTNEVVAFLIRALDEPGDARSESAARALKSLGTGAVDQLAARLSEPGCGPEAAGSVAAILANLPGECSEVLRSKVTQGFDSMRDVLTSPSATAEEKELARKKTGSLTWAASSRPAAEQGTLAPVLADQLGRTTDAQQAGTLVWGIGEMRGLSETGRVELLLGALAQQRDGGIRHTIAGSFLQMVSSGAAGPFDDTVRRLVASAMASEQDPTVLEQLRQVQEKLDARR
jgi:hypothetical protein